MTWFPKGWIDINGFTKKLRFLQSRVFNTHDVWSETYIGFWKKKISTSETMPSIPPDVFIYVAWVVFHILINGCSCHFSILVFIWWGWIYVSFCLTYHRSTCPWASLSPNTCDRHLLHRPVYMRWGLKGWSISKLTLWYPLLVHHCESLLGSSEVEVRPSQYY